MRQYLQERAGAQDLVDLDEPVEQMSFQAFCNSLPDMPEDYAFLAPFAGIFPDRKVIVDAPTSHQPDSLSSHFDLDSAHLVGDRIPVLGKLALFTLVDYKYTIRSTLHYKFTLPGFREPIELYKIPNFRIGQFGQLSRWQVCIIHILWIVLWLIHYHPNTVGQCFLPCHIFR